MQKAILPLRYIGISQPMYGKTSHIGLKAIDFGWNSNYYEQSTVLLAPFDGKVVWKKGSGNTIAFQSNEKVITSKELLYTKTEDFNIFYDKLSKFIEG